MKYHALKMEEVNDTMRHLWNKTYQGTGASFGNVEQSLLDRGAACAAYADIDGIKISSDSEGGPSKRTYNYRVRSAFVRSPGILRILMM